MTLMFERDTSCKRCDLCTGQVKSVCIPARRWSVPRLDPDAQALVVIGKAPGLHEDNANQCFVGPNGQILDDWLTSLNLTGVTVYLTNVVRCRPVDNANLTARQINACAPFLQADVDAIAALYDNRVTILCLGAAACRTITGGSQRDWYKQQGQQGIFPFPTFATIQPVACLPGRDPAQQHAVADHMRLLARHLNGDVPSGSYLDGPTKYVLAPAPPTQMPDVLSVDIETYGIREDLPEQRFFHPMRSMLDDGIINQPDQLIQTIAIAWHEGPAVKSAVFLWANRDHRYAFRSWIKAARAAHTSLLFMNAPFDLSYLRTQSMLKDAGLDHGIPVEDLAVWSYLFSEVRPEKSLKAVAPLLGIAQYEHGFTRYKRADDPELLAYNVKDAVATLLCRDRVRQDIAAVFGTDSPKLSTWTREWYSRVIWLAVMMSETGVALDVKTLREAAWKCDEDCDDLINKAKSDWGLIIAGKGSQSHVQDLIDRAVASVPGLDQHPDLERSDKKDLISTGEMNLRLLLGELPLHSFKDFRAPIQLLHDYRACRKLIGTYYRPLIGIPKGYPVRKKKPDLSQRLIAGIAYPIWSPVPLEWATGSESLESGTRQSRFSCKKPALPTLPGSVACHKTSRYRPGFLGHWDLSQIEMVAAAFLSGDSKMLAEYAVGVDRHTARAIEIFGPDCESHPDFKFKRHVAKIVNFRILYRGGARGLRATLRRKISYEATVSWCQAIIDWFVFQYPEFYEWQERLIRDVSAKGHFSDPILGQGRTFTRSEKVNRHTYVSTIVNCPIQMCAANLMLAAQTGVAFYLAEEGYESQTTLNVYDSLDVDGPLKELSDVRVIVDTNLKNTGYRARLEEYYGRTIPMSWETEAREFPRKA